MSNETIFNHDEDNAFKAIGMTEERFDELAEALAKSYADRISEEIEFISKQNWTEVEKIYMATKLGEFIAQGRRMSKIAGGLGALLGFDVEVCGCDDCKDDTEKES